MSLSVQQTVHSERMDADGNTGYAMEYITQKIFAKNKIKNKKKKKQVKEKKEAFYSTYFCSLKCL